MGCVEGRKSMNYLVQTEGGKVKGRENGGVIQFHGIPYAKPPVGDRRFALPDPELTWEGVYDASFRRPMAPQGISDTDSAMGSSCLAQDEDCLTLSVSAPELTGNLPVAVWFHGGANCYGGGDLEIYDGGELAENGKLVCVNLNFRLGALGFLQYPGLNEENLSIEDQICALRWIQRNIRQFGGDPARITLFGQSAGGNAIVHLLSRKDTEGLFQQIVLESPSLGRGNHKKEDAFQIGRVFLEELGINTAWTGDKLRTEACKKPVSEILAATARLWPVLGPKYENMFFKPVLDEWHTPKQTVRAAAEEASRRHIRLLIGFAKDEMRAFVIPKNGAEEERLRRQQELRYEIPGLSLAEALCAAGCEVYAYRFVWGAPDSERRACHCIELPFVFGNLDAWEAPMLKGASREELERLKNTLQPLWCRFFNFQELPEDEWPPFTSQSRKIKCFDNAANPVRTLEAVQAERRQA